MPTIHYADQASLQKPWVDQCTLPLCTSCHQETQEEQVMIMNKSKMALCNYLVWCHIHGPLFFFFMSFKKMVAPDAGEEVQRGEVK